MNALEIIQALRQHGAELAIEAGDLVVQGRGPKLPDQLRDELAIHKADLMVALGCPIDRTIASVMNDIRPHLPPSLRQLPDDRLLILVNLSIIQAWCKAVERVNAGR